MLKVHGVVVPGHVVPPPSVNVPLQPVNVEPVAGVTVSVPVAVLSSATEHVEVHGLGLGAGVFGTTLEKAIEPGLGVAGLNVIVRFLLAATYGPTNGPP